MNHVLLSNVEHRRVSVADYPSVQFGDNVNYALIIPSEFKSAQSIYPIFIQKDSANGKLFFSALLGFQEGENLFLEGDTWNADYIPLSLLRNPFLIGNQKYLEAGEEKHKHVIIIDTDSPRVNHVNGRHLFDESGAPSEYLKSIRHTLELLHVGVHQADQLISQLLEYDLLEMFTLRVTFNNHKKYEIPNMYTINERALSNLPDAQLIALHREGNLEKVYAILNSQLSVKNLIRLKNHHDSA